jgi:hypothetical protein
VLAVIIVATGELTPCRASRHLHPMIVIDEVHDMFSPAPSCRQNSMAIDFAAKWAEKGLASIRGIWRALTDEEQDTLAPEIVEHLELCNWKIEAGRPLGGRGQGIIPKLDEGDGE